MKALRLALAVVVPASLAGGLAKPAAAQPDPMAEQRCVWSCLSRARGASDPAYHACVRRECEAAPAPAASRPARPAATARPWQRAAGVAYPAVGACLADNPNLCLIVACPEPGRVTVELHGVENGWVAGIPVRLQAAGRTFAATLPERQPGTGLFRWPAAPPLLDALKTGSEARLEIEGGVFALPLAGSGAAIGGVEKSCG